MQLCLTPPVRTLLLPAGLETQLVCKVLHIITLSFKYMKQRHSNEILVFTDLIKEPQVSFRKR